LYGLIAVMTTMRQQALFEIIREYFNRLDFCG